MFSWVGNQSDMAAPDDQVARLGRFHSRKTRMSAVQIGRFRVEIRKTRKIIDIVHQVRTIHLCSAPMQRCTVLRDSFDDCLPFIAGKHTALQLGLGCRHGISRQKRHCKKHRKRDSRDTSDALKKPERCQSGSSGRHVIFL